MNAPDRYRVLFVCWLEFYRLLLWTRWCHGIWLFPLAGLFSLFTISSSPLVGSPVLLQCTSLVLQHCYFKMSHLRDREPREFMQPTEMAFARFISSATCRHSRQSSINLENDKQPRWIWCAWVSGHVLTQEIDTSRLSWHLVRARSRLRLTLVSFFF